MLWPVFFAALASAFLHVSWNAAAKKRDNPGAAVLGILFAGAILSLIAWMAILLFVGPPPSAIWKWVLLAVPLAAIGYTALRAAYDRTEYALAYCAARGVIPPILATVDWWLGAHMEAMNLLGMAAILLGFVLFSFKAARLGTKDVSGLTLAFLAGLMLASSLYFDTRGTRLPDVQRTWGIEYVVVTTFLSCLLVAAIGEVQAKRSDLLEILRRQGLFKSSREAMRTVTEFSESLRVLKSDMAFSFLAALTALASIALALWAYAQGPIWLVASLRETNVVFAGLVAVFYVRERILPYQWAAIVLTGFGAIFVKVNW
jgi:drug/metabolite transporter (DMT)-like permease